MGKEEQTPSESEWKIMEVLWESGKPLTSAEVIQRMRGDSHMTPKMIRVLMNRLSQKGLLGYEVDAHDSRVYHYTPLRSREDCLKEKSQRFTDSYFSGNKPLAATNAMAALLQSFDLTDEQLEELEEILRKKRLVSQSSKNKKG